MPTLCIVIWHGFTVHLIGSHDFISSWAWVCPPRWDKFLFCRWHLLNSGPRLTRFICWWIFVMHISHQIHFWPHTLRGICYNPKFHHTCTPGIKPSYLLFFPSHHWATLLKNTIFEYVCALHHYCLHMYVICTTNAHVRMLVTPLQPAYAHKSCKK